MPLPTPTPNEQDRLLDHSYDGIQEFDNPLPRWWVWIFWATIIYAVLYTFDVTGRVKGPGRIAEYDAQIAEAAARWPKPTGTVDAAALTAMLGDARVVADGKVAFTTSCAACHRADGGGLIGPNLTDDYWIHGATLTDILRTITDGVLDKGMPPWGKILSPEQMTAVTVYVASLRGTNPKDAKAPQGVKADSVVAK